MGTRNDGPGPDPADLEGLARRFQDLWQEQLAATASDPEFMEMMGKWMGALAAGGMSPPAPPPGAPGGQLDPAAWMATMQRALAEAGTKSKGRADDATSGARSPKAGATSAAAASRTGHVGGDDLERRLADLEQRVGRLEAALGGARKGAAGRPRRRKS